MARRHAAQAPALCAARRCSSKKSQVPKLSRLLSSLSWFEGVAKSEVAQAVSLCIVQKSN